MMINIIIMTIITITIIMCLYISQVPSYEYDNALFVYYNGKKYKKVKIDRKKFKMKYYAIN